MSSISVGTFDPKSNKNQKFKQQDMTELNSDGNRDRGREGEDLRVHDKCGTPDCCGECDTASTGNNG